TAMAAFCCCRRCWAGSPISKNCSPTAPIKGRSSPKRSPKSCLWSRSRSSNDPIRRKDSSRYPSAGSSSERSPGSTAVEDWPRTGRTSTSQPSCSFVSPPSASCCEGSAIPHRLSSQTLRKVLRQVCALAVKPGLEAGEAPAKPCDVEILKSPRAAADQALSAFEQAKADRRIGGRDGNVAERPHQPEADRGVGDGIMADLLEGEIEQAVKTDPGRDDAQDVRGIVVIALRRRPAHPADQHGAELIDRADCGRRIVDRRRNRPQGDVDDLHDAEFDVLLHRAGRADVDGVDELQLAIHGDPRAASDPEQGAALWNELADPALQPQANAVGFRQRVQAADVDEPDVAGSAA